MLQLCVKCVSFNCSLTQLFPIRCNYLWMMRSPTTFPVEEKYHKRVIIACWLAVNLSWTPSFINDRLTSYYPPGQCGYGVSRNRIFVGAQYLCRPIIMYYNSLIRFNSIFI